MRKIRRYGKNQWKIKALNLFCDAAILALVVTLGVQGSRYILPPVQQFFLESKTDKKDSAPASTTQERNASLDEADAFASSEAVEEISVEAQGSNESQVQNAPKESSEATNEKALEASAPAEEALEASAPAEETPSKQPARRAQLYNGVPDLSALKALPVVAAQASSTIAQSGNDNSAMMMFDGREETSWQEGSYGLGGGEYVAFSLDDFYDIYYMSFKLGNWRNWDYYVGNARPRTLEIILADFQQAVEFPDEKREYWVSFSEPIRADSLRIELRDAYPGRNWEDTCIAEVTVFGKK